MVESSGIDNQNTDQITSPGGSFAKETLANPRLVPGLEFSLKENSGRLEYILEDTYRDRFFRIGAREFDFIIQMDGQREIGNALAHANAIHAQDPLSQEEAGEIVLWLLKEKLVISTNADQPEPNHVVGSGNRIISLLSKINLLFVRVSLLNPDKILSRVVPSISWLLGWPLLMLWVVIVGSGSFQILSHWREFSQASQGVFYPLNWLWLIIAYVVLKTSHEIFHGLISKNYGGKVLEAGVMFILFIPIGYVNASSAWHFPNKWQRFHTAIAGMFIELMFAGLSCWLWALSSPGALNSFAYNVILIAGVSTLLFNANPLMRFDGYFALSDALNIPNLYSKGQAYVRYLVQRHLLGLKTKNPIIGKAALFIKIYGLAAALWRMTILIVILVGAYSLFYGAGVVLAIIGAAAFLVPPVLGYVRSIKAEQQGLPQYLRTVFRMSCLVLGIVTLLTQVNWQRDVVVPGVVDYAKNGIVRAKSTGFLHDVAVGFGEPVTQGQILGTLVNKELESEVATIKQQLNAASVRAGVHLNREETANHEIELNRISALKETLANKEHLVESLVLRAPIDGFVIDARVQEKLGHYYRTGEEVMRIGQDDDKQLYFSVAANRQINTVTLQEPLRFKFAMNSSQKDQFVEIKHIVPRMTRHVEYTQLTALNGGPLTVIETSDGELELSEPRTEYAGIFLGGSEEARAGGIAWVRLPAASYSVGKALTHSLSQWINHLFDKERWH